MKNTGEVNIYSKLGTFLYNISKNTEYTKYVETGTKNGDGTTFCILKGLLERNDNSILLGYETNNIFFNTAVNNCKEYLNNKIFIYNKTLVSYDELPENKFWNGNSKSQYNYNIDLKNCEIEKKIDFIDVLLLDSGGWSRQAEWNKYKNDIKVIILDDTKISTNLIRDEIINSNQWIILKDELNDRNGWFAAERK